MDNQTNDPVVVQQPIATTEDNTKTVFGVSALSLPTPDKIKAIFKFITFLTVIIPIALTGLSGIPSDVKSHILEVMGVIVLILQKAEDFWGIRVDK